MTFDEWFVRYPLPAEIDTMDDTDREQWTTALRWAYKTGAESEREACAKLCDDMARQYDISIDPVEELIACETAAAIRARGQT